MPTISVKDANGTPQTVPLNPVTGTAGTPSTEVISVQGVASGTPVTADITKIGGAAIALGTTTASASLPVTPASDATFTTNDSIATASGNITTQNLVPAGVATAGSAVELTVSNSSTATIQVTGTYTGALSLQGTVDGSVWVTVGGTPFLNANTGTYLATITSALQSIFQVEVSGFLKVRVTGLSAMTGTAAVTIRGVAGAAMVAIDAALPAGSAIIGSLAANQSTNVAQFGGNNVVTGTGVGGVGIPRVTISSDSSLAANQSCNIAQMNGVAVTMGNGVAGTGVQRVAIASDNSVFGINCAQMNGVAVAMNNGTASTGTQRVVIASDNTANSNPWLVTPVASAAQGASTTHHLISAATTNATSVKASAGTINDGCISNINAAVRYFKLYNKASAPTVGTDTPILTLLLPVNQTVEIPTGGLGLRCSTGIAYALTTGITVADTGAVGASEHSVHINYT